jgi:hypothetical protein
LKRWDYGVGFGICRFMIQVERLGFRVEGLGLGFKVWDSEFRGKGRV